MDKKYQVFVSSTYEDLREERQYVMQALLQLNCIPSGMELFPAADQGQWELIKQVIDECDYYIVILGGRYGSIGPNKKSYTQMEYEYAVEKEKPVMGFVHGDPGSIPTKKTDPENTSQLRAFRELVQSKICKHWRDAGDLGAKVSFALSHAIRTKPAIGWVRANDLPSEKVASEIAGLKEEIAVLRLKIGEHAVKLATEDEVYTFKIQTYDNQTKQPSVDSIELSWGEMFNLLGRPLLSTCTEREINSCLTQKVWDGFVEKVKDKSISSEIDDNDTAAIITQFIAYGWIESAGMRQWRFTPNGERKYALLKAIPSRKS